MDVGLLLLRLAIGALLVGHAVQKLTGSYTAVVGLPLAETVQLLVGEGYEFHEKWQEG